MIYFILKAISILGKMNHISSTATVDGCCEKCKHPYKRLIMIPHNGIMTMSVEDRRELISMGTELVKYKDGEWYAVKSD